MTAPVRKRPTSKSLKRAGVSRPPQQDGPMYVLARGNAGRPVCQHKLEPGVATRTACGRDMERWSVYYTRERFEPILCKRSACWA